MTINLLTGGLRLFILLVLLFAFGWWALYHLTFLWKFIVLIVPLAGAAIYFQKE